MKTLAILGLLLVASMIPAAQAISPFEAIGNLEQQVLDAINEVVVEVAQLTTDVTNIQTDIVTINTELDVIDTSIVNIETDVISIDNRLTTTETQVTVNTNDLIDVNASITTIENTLSGIPTQLADFGDDITSLNTAQVGIEQRLTIAEEHIEDHHQNLEPTVSTLETDVATLETNYSGIFNSVLRTTVVEVLDEAIVGTIYLTCNEGEILVNGGWQVSDPYLKVATGLYPVNATTLALDVRIGVEPGVPYTITLSGLCIVHP